MNLTVLTSGGRAFAHIECVAGRTFKIATAGVDCALLPIITANLGQSVYSSVRFRRLECRSPHALT